MTANDNDPRFAALDDTLRPYLVEAFSMGKIADLVDDDELAVTFLAIAFEIAAAEIDPLDVTDLAEAMTNWADEIVIEITPKGLALADELGIEIGSARRPDDPDPDDPDPDDDPPPAAA